MTKKKIVYEEVVIDKLVHGGQGLGSLADGRKVFVWNSLPGETVKARITKSKRDFAEAIAEEIIVPSKDRQEPKETIYLATSPWQIMSLETENKYKSQILGESFMREGLDTRDIEMISDGKDYAYRNKIEFSFYGDDDGLHFAFYNRGTHSKQIVLGSALALPAINQGAKDILAELNTLGVRASDLKSLILRCSAQGRVVAALFVKTKSFPDIKLPSSVQGLKVYYSNPKSPASVVTKQIYSLGDTKLSDSLMDLDMQYDVTGFFQVNIPVFELALKQIAKAVKGHKDVVDMYAGVGSIGIPIKTTRALIELDPANVYMAKQNVANQKIEVIQSSSESALEYIQADTCLIVDPPRAGLHKDVVQRILDAKPAKICYLSCNPSTQSRDIAMLTDAYIIESVEGYNFFPRTPHIESLCILVRK